MAAAAEQELLLHLKLAFLAREPPACVLSLARKAGGGSVTPHVQNFILESCTGNNAGGDQNCSYVTTILKRIIAEAELSSDIVIDGLYEEFGQFMSSKSNNSSLNRTEKIYKEISFISPTICNKHLYVDDNKRVSLVARLSCSINMLEGDTGCSLWPSSLFLSEFILSYPKIFSRKCCSELGSGVGLVGVCLNYVNASKVILTDGDASTLENMKGNMEMNSLCVEQEGSQLPEENKNKVQCKYLSWEETSESDLWDCKPDLVGNNRGTNSVANKEETSNEFSSAATEVPVAYIATVIRNVETFNCFDKAAADAKLSVVNITNSEAPLSLLPYMLSYDRSSVQLLKITLLS
uniref:FAM86 N-terminal domain-containing protein n=1 Tax=Oryza meridionalis TaxID=40149 RepID=A0A0E0DLT7_9ORYZ